MPDGNVSGVRPDSILSPEELDALRFAQDLYGAQAKQAAEELAHVLELNEVARDQLIGSVALKLDGLNFEERRGLVFDFRNLSARLGGVAAVGAQYVGAESNGHDSPVEVAPVTPVLAEESQGDSAVAPVPETNASAPAFAKHQRSWLGRLYDEENVDRIEALSLEERAEFFGSLTAYYRQLSITRLNSDAKAKRSDQLVALMVDSKSYSELAEEAGVSHAGVRLGITKMAESIAKRSNPDQLQALIPAPKTVDEIELDEALESNGGSASSPEAAAERPEVTAWLSGLYSEAQLDIIENLTEADRSKFGKALAEMYSSLRIRRLEDKGRQIRVQLIELIMSGESIKAAGQSLGLNTVRVKDVLARTADGFMKQTTPAERSVLLANCLDPAQPLHVDVAEQRNAAQTGIAAQKKWLKKVFEDGEVIHASLTELEPEQLEYFVGRLTSRLNASIIKSQGPEKTSRRIRAVEMLLIDGASYEAIAQETGIDVQTVKQELHHSSQRLKSKNQPAELTAILRDAVAFRPEPEKTELVG